MGGSERPGQVEMADAVARSFQSGEHLVVQAGTGTGKSLAYLIPAVVRALDDNAPVVVSTATIALQRQLVDRDLPGWPTHSPMHSPPTAVRAAQGATKLSMSE
ncbi:DEAD/DEAH box helicase family protein [Mycobacterium ulcerans str. Harvey]|uniref:DEAD/DEAH box helicase family protein n=1 Tax=Mycobacterium ulcerans str. Harvey TaxID=1299332 RepID=A0ABN0QQZ1_MYCUL|nr:DEAD/DEAH box helicase family protein [Mycobacterium ulcerans str. Harvey]